MNMYELHVNAMNEVPEQICQHYEELPSDSSGMVANLLSTCFKIGRRIGLLLVSAASWDTAWYALT